MIHNMKRSYLILFVSFFLILGLHSLKSVVQSHRLEKDQAELEMDIEVYIQRIHECRLAFPRANARELHICATE